VAAAAIAACAAADGADGIPSATLVANSVPSFTNNAVSALLLLSSIMVVLPTVTDLHAYQTPSSVVNIKKEE
jgi:hypothetical protein